MPENRTINNLGTQIVEDLNSEIRTIFLFRAKRWLSDIFSKKFFFHDDRWKILRWLWKFQPLGQKGSKVLTQDVIWSENNPSYDGQSFVLT